MHTDFCPFLSCFGFLLQSLFLNYFIFINLQISNPLRKVCSISLQAEATVKGPWNTAGSVATEDMPRKPLIVAAATKPWPMGGLERSVRPPSSPMAANGFPVRGTGRGD